MTTIEKIKAEIERRITDNTFGAKFELIDILAWLSTLESEKPMNQDELEEEIHKYNKERFDEYFPEQDGDFISEVDFMTCLGRVARHFAQWGAEQILREVEQWVEKNTCRYIDTQNDGEGYITDVFLENSFVDDLEERMKEILAQWGAEHLKK